MLLRMLALRSDGPQDRRPATASSLCQMIEPSIAASVTIW
jgi:hypothetical protein